MKSTCIQLEDPARPDRPPLVQIPRKKMSRESLFPAEVVKRVGSSRTTKCCVPLRSHARCAVRI
jgi:hypothetical protein